MIRQAVRRTPARSGDPARHLIGQALILVVALAVLVPGAPVAAAWIAAAANGGR